MEEPNHRILGERKGAKGGIHRASFGRRAERCLDKQVDGSAEAR